MDTVVFPRVRECIYDSSHVIIITEKHQDIRISQKSQVHCFTAYIGDPDAVYDCLIEFRLWTINQFSVRYRLFTWQNFVLRDINCIYLSILGFYLS